MFKSITIEVIGEREIVCDGCEQRIEKALKTLQGVAKVRANSRNQRIDVLLDTVIVDAAAIVEHIAKAGYQAQVLCPGGGHRE